MGRVRLHFALDFPQELARFLGLEAQGYRARLGPIAHRRQVLVSHAEHRLENIPRRSDRRRGEKLGQNVLNERGSAATTTQNDRTRRQAVASPATTRMIAIFRLNE